MRLPQEAQALLAAAAIHPRFLDGYLAHPNATDILPVVVDSVQRTHAIAPEVIQGWVLTLLALVETPPSLHGILRVLPAIEVLLRCFLPAGLQQPGTLPFQVLASLTNELKRHPHAKQFGARPRRAGSPLFRMHLGAAAQLGARPAIQPLYARHLPDFHRGFLAVSGSRAARNTLKGYAWTIRTFLATVPPPASRLPVNKDRCFKESLGAWNSQYAGQNKAHHLRQLSALYQRKGVVPHPHGGPGTGAASVSLLGREREIERLDDLGALLLPGRPPKDSFRFLEIATDVSGAASEDPGRADTPDPQSHDRVYTEDPSERTVEEPPWKQHEKLSYFLLSQYRIWWDPRNSVSTPRLIALYQFTQELLTRPTKTLGSQERALSKRAWDAIEPTRRSVVLMILLTLFTGRQPRDLIKTQLAPYPAPEGTSLPSQSVSPDTLFFDWKRLWFFSSQEKARADFAGAPEHGWCQSTPHVPFPLPSMLVPLMRPYLAWLETHGQLLEGAVLFQERLPGGTLGPLPLITIDRLLRSRAARLRRLPAFTAIAGAFFPLMVHGCHLDEVLARLVSGRGLLSAYAQLYYTWIPLPRLFAAYEQACTRLHNWISYAAMSRGWFEQRRFPDRATEPASILADIGVGSPLILKVRHVARAAVALRERIRRTARLFTSGSVIAHHNAYCAIAYLALLYVGVRPLNSPSVTVREVQALPDYLAISDKQSATAFEHRLLHLPACVAALLQALAYKRAALRRAVRDTFGTRAMLALPTDPLFHFLGAKGSAIPFSLDMYSRTLEAAGAGLPIDAPLNTGRHWVRTALRDAGFADDAIDAWLGHQRAGREMLGPLSSASYASAMEEVRAFLDARLVRLGFAPLAYLPSYHTEVDDGATC